MVAYNMRSMCSVLCLFRHFSGLSSTHRPVFKIAPNLGYRSLFFNAKGSESREAKGEQDQNKATSEGPEESVAGESPVQEERVKALEEECKSLLEKVKDIDDKYKRALAEGENSRIRMRRQIEEAKIFGIQKFCKDLLEVADVLGLAMETVPKEEVNEKNAVLKNLFDGVQMTEKQLQTVFKRHGLMQMNPMGEKFNPNEHHALFEIEEEGKEPGTVGIVTKIGYKLQERTIRPAMVGVVKSKAHGAD